MYIPDDKDIDRLSKEAAEHYQAPGTPAWDALRKTLEKQLPQEKEKKRRGFLFFFLLFIGLSLAGTTIWYGIHRSNPVPSSTKTIVNKKREPNEKIATEQAIAKTKTSPDRVANKINQGSPAGTETTDHSAINTIDSKGPKAGVTTVLAPQHNGVNTAGKQKDAVLGTIPVKNKSNTQRLQNNVIPLSNTVAGNDDRINRSRSFIQVAKQYRGSKKTDYTTALANGIHSKNLNGKPARINKKQIVETDNTSGTTQQEGNHVAETENNDKDIARQHDLATVPASKDPVNTPQKAESDSAIAKNATPEKNIDSAKPAATKAKTASKSEKAILLGLTAGFDFSTVKFTYGSNAGYNIGLMGGYQFNKHWAVLTGIVYTKKNYKLNGKDYNPPKHDWTYYVDLQKVDGFCRMWELPVTARYIFNPGAKNAFFATAGLSSYFMKKQQYDYYYKNSMGVPMTAPWHSDSTYTHVFSILDISAGVQKPIGKHMDLLIEPYAKIPLGGVGHGNIRLSSFGVNLTVQYKKPLKR